MAAFCIATKLSPRDYYALTLRERSAFVRVLNEMHGGGD